MAEPFIGEIRMAGFNFAPRNWAHCDGQILSIDQNTALFSLLGATYGGDGISTFALPDLRGRVPVHPGPDMFWGRPGGSETHTLSMRELPAHSHTVNASTATGDLDTPFLAMLSVSDQNYVVSDDAPSGQLVVAPLSGVGNGVGHPNVQPSLVVNFIIALYGDYPARD